MSPVAMLFREQARQPLQCLTSTLFSVRHEMQARVQVKVRSRAREKRDIAPAVGMSIRPRRGMRAS